MPKLTTPITKKSIGEAGITQWMGGAKNYKWHVSPADDIKIRGCK